MMKEIEIQKLFLYMATILCLGYCQQFNEALLISNLYPIEITQVQNINYPIQFEFWSFCMPQQELITYPTLQVIEGEQLYWDVREQQFLFLIRNSSDNQVFLFMYTDVITSNYVIHQMQINNTQVVDFIYDPNEYEGIWILHLITLDQLKIVYQASGGAKEILFEYNLVQSLNNLQFCIGGTGTLNQIYLGVFRGRLSKLFIHYSDSKFVDIYNLRINELKIYEYEQKISLIPDVLDFDGLLQKEFEFDQFGRKFSIFGWAKYYIYNAYSLKQYLLVRLTIFKNYQDETYIGDE